LLSPTINIALRLIFSGSYKLRYEKPEVILDKIEALEDQIKANVAELRKLLGED
jgi:hypothetical protein